MKRITFLIAFMFATTFSIAQDKTELSKKNASEEYCMILATSKLLSTKLTIEVDFGQEWSFWKDKRSLRDENGKKIVFNSVIDALNYMSADGWKFVNAYAITVGSQNVYHYVMRRELTEKDKTEDIVETSNQ